MKPDVLPDDELDYKAGSGSKSSVMSLKDVASKLVKNLPEEIAGANEYLAMAKVVKRADHCEDAYTYLMEMFKDEYTHAKFIHMFMKDHNIPVPEVQDEAFKKLEEEVERYFR